MPEFDLTMLVLSAICVAEAEGKPMTAGAIAFLLDMPETNVDLSLDELIADGSIKPDGAHYRLTRPLTEMQLAKMMRLGDQLQHLSDKTPLKLHS